MNNDEIDRSNWHEGLEKTLFPNGKPEHGANVSEPEPKPNTNPRVWSLVISDMVDRNMMGIKKYGTPLQPFNGRDALWDAYQEALDLVVYLRQAIYERDNNVEAKK